MFTIYSIGDSAFLEQILIAIAMISGTGNFEQMVAIGLLIGVIIMAFTSLFNGGKEIPFQQILVCWIIYAMAFGNNSTVVIEDGYTGEARVVANVPLGVAAAGGIISNVGYSLTRMFETGYGVIAPGITESHFADALVHLNTARRRLADPEVFEAINDVNGGGHVDARRSITNYIQDCTLVKIDLGYMSADELVKTNVSPAIRFNSETYGTQIHNLSGNPNGQYMNCIEGYMAIEDMLATLAIPEVERAIATVTRRNVTYLNNTAQVTDSLTALGVAGSDAQSFMRTAILEPLYYDAAAGKYQDMRDFTSAAMVNQALTQRNTQWSTEASMFMTIVRPMLTFIEGFVYAITPLMAFLIVMGGFGIKLVVKYAQMLIWTQLWMPVLSIVNLFLYMSAMGEMASYSMDTAGLYNFYALNTADAILEHWIATGGMLAAATPILTLVLVTGSSYAMTSLAGRMHGSDHVDEKMASPDLMTNGAVMQNMPANVNNPTTGNRAHGAEAMVGTLSIGSQMQDNVQSSEAHVASSQQAVGTNLSQGLTQSGSFTQRSARANDIAATVAASGGTAASGLAASSASFSDTFGVSDSHNQMLKGEMAAAASAGVGLNLPGGIFKAGSEGAIRAAESGTDTFSMSNDELMSFMSSTGFTESQFAELRKSLSEGYSERSDEGFQATWGEERASQISESSQDAVSAQDQYAETKSLANIFGSGQSINKADLAQRMLGNSASARAARQDLDAAMTYMSRDNPELRQAASNREAILQDDHNFSPQSAKIIAQLETLTDRANYDSESRFVAAYNEVAKVAGTAMGRNFGQAQDASGNSHLADQTPDVGSLRDRHGGTLQAPGSRGSMEDYTAGAAQPPSPEGAQRLYDNGSRLAEGAFEEARGEAFGFAAAETEQRLGEQRERADAHLINAGDSRSALATVGGAVQSAINVVQGLLGDTTNDIVSRVSALEPGQIESLRESTNNGHNLENNESWQRAMNSMDESEQRIAAATMRSILGNENAMEGLSATEQAQAQLGVLNYNLNRGSAASESEQQATFEAFREQGREMGLGDGMASYYASKFIEGSLGDDFKAFGMESLRNEYMHTTGKTENELTERDERIMQAQQSVIDNTADSFDSRQSLTPIHQWQAAHNTNSSELLGGASSSGGGGGQGGSASQPFNDDRPLPVIRLNEGSLQDSRLPVFESGGGVSYVEPPTSRDGASLGGDRQSEHFTAAPMSLAASAGGGLPQSSEQITGENSVDARVTLVDNEGAPAGGHAGAPVIPPSQPSAGPNDGGFSAAQERYTDPSLRVTDGSEYGDDPLRQPPIGSSGSNSHKRPVSADTAGSGDPDAMAASRQKPPTGSKPNN